MSTSIVFKRFFLFGFVIMSFFSLWRCLVTPAPIYGSDEYAYLASALSRSAEDRIKDLKRDPMLQQVNDPVYDAILRKAILFGKDPALSIRFLNWILFYGCVGLIGFYFLKYTKNELAPYLFVFLLGLLPSGVWVLSTMPDIFVASLFSILVMGYIFFNQQRWLVNICAAIILSLLAYVKPHAISFFIGFVLYLCCQLISAKRASGKNWLTLGLFLCSTLLSIACMNKYYYHYFSLKPLFIGDVYKPFVNGCINQKTFPVLQLKLIIWYALGYVSSLLFLFPLAIYSLVLMKNRPSRKIVSSERLFNFSKLSLLSTLSLIGMASLFAASQKIGGGESLRLWGRYLLPVFPLWLLLSACAWNNEEHSDEDKRKGMLIAFFGMMVGAAYILINKFRLYTWDYPELFCLFSPKNNYWNFSFIPYAREGTLGFIGLIFSLFFIRNTQWQLRLLTTIQVAIAMVALACASLWQGNHAEDISVLKAAAESCDFILPEKANVMIVTNERYGAGSYVAYGFHRKPWIIELARDTELTEKTIPAGIDYLITTTSYKVKFSYLYRIQIGSLDVYILNGSITNIFSLGKKIIEGPN